jgi:hypothetical protein
LCNYSLSLSSNTKSKKFEDKRTTKSDECMPIAGTMASSWPCQPQCQFGAPLNTYIYSAFAGHELAVRRGRFGFSVSIANALRVLAAQGTCASFNNVAFAMVLDDPQNALQALFAVFVAQAHCEWAPVLQV